MTTEREMTVRPGVELGPDVSDAPASERPPVGWPPASDVLANPCYRVALLFAQHYGLPVHPLNGKKPLLKEWQLRTTPPSTEEVREWFTKNPNANLGIVTGKASRLAVIDVDSQDAERWLCDLVLTPAARKMALVALDREWFPDDEAFEVAVRGVILETALGTLRVNTSVTRDGFQKYQLYFNYPAEGDFPSNASDVYPDIDTRGDGGQVATPPSIHPGDPDKGIAAGAVYTVANPGAPRLDVPKEFLAVMRKAAAPPSEPLRDDDDDAPTIEEAEELLSCLNPATRLTPHDMWLRVGMALFDAFHDTGDADEALELWDKHSQRADNYRRGECAKRWKSFHGGRQRKVTIKTLQKWANEDTRHGIVERYNKRYAVLKSGGRTIMEFTPWDDAEPVKYYELSRIKAVTANDRVRRGKQSIAAFDIWLRHPERRTLQRLVFDPEAKRGEIPSRSKEPSELDWNLWCGWAVEPTAAGSCKKILAHLYEVICCKNPDAYAYLLMWLAALVQRPARPVGTALGLRGKQGSGKTTLAMIMKAILGRAQLSVSHETHVTGQFNAHQEGIILLDAEEAFFAGDKRAAGVLKHLITSPTIAITRKFVDTFEIPNYVRIIVTSNERWVVPADFEDRRWTVLDVSNGRVGDRAYFNALYDEIHGGGAARFLHHLLHEVTVDWDRLRTPFITAALAEQKVRTLDPVLEFLRDAADSASCPGDSSGTGRVEKDRLARAFDQWRLSKHRSGYGLSDAQFKADVKRHLLDLCPDSKIEQRGREGDRRTRDFLLPPVAALREGFEKKLGAAQDWSTDPSSQSGWYPAPGESYA